MTATMITTKVPMSRYVFKTTTIKSARAQGWYSSTPRCKGSSLLGAHCSGARAKVNGFKFVYKRVAWSLGVGAHPGCGPLISSATVRALRAIRVQAGDDGGSLLLYHRLRERENRTSRPTYPQFTPLLRRLFSSLSLLRERCCAGLRHYLLPL